MCSYISLSLSLSLTHTCIHTPFLESLSHSLSLVRLLLFFVNSQLQLSSFPLCRSSLSLSLSLSLTSTACICPHVSLFKDIRVLLRSRGRSDINVGMLNFGMPRIGNAAFAAGFASLIDVNSSFRLVHRFPSRSILTPSLTHDPTQN